MKVSVCAAVGLALLWGIADAGTVRAQAWAEKMFDHTSHDFGMVARGAKVEHVFTFRNPYVEDVRIASVRTTCLCTRPRYTTDVVETYETGQVVATVDTRQFTGRKDATLTVTFDKPFPAEVQLHTYVYIRTDVVVKPGKVSFGTVPQGTAQQERVTVSYAGRSDWRILSADSGVSYLQPELKERSRRGGSVVYDLTVTLAPDAPAGYLQSRIRLTTNDRNENARVIEVPVDGIVQADVVVRPTQWLLGELARGATASKAIVIQAREPFRVLDVKAPDGRFSAVLPESAKAVQVIPVKFQAGAQSADEEIACRLRIETDLENHPILEIPVLGKIVGGGP